VRPSRRCKEVAKLMINEITKIDKMLTYDSGTTGRDGIEMMLANKFDPAIHNPTGWLISEKLDGVRCYWDGNTMWTRNGNLFYPPAWFVK